MRPERVEPEHVLAWRSEDGNWVWTFVLDEHDGTTRLISRNRFRLPTLAAADRHAADGAASLLMERKMLRGIKRGPKTRGDDRLEVATLRRLGRVPERSNGAVSKTVKGASSSRVQIPPPP